MKDYLKQHYVLMQVTRQIEEFLKDEDLDRLPELDNLILQRGRILNLIDRLEVIEQPNEREMELARGILREVVELERNNIIGLEDLKAQAKQSMRELDNAKRQLYCMKQGYAAKKKSAARVFNQYC